MFNFKTSKSQDFAGLSKLPPAITISTPNSFVVQQSSSFIHSSPSVSGACTFQGIYYKPGTSIPIKSKFGTNYSLLNVTTNTPVALDGSGIGILENNDTYCIILALIEPEPLQKVCLENLLINTQSHHLYFFSIT